MNWSEVLPKNATLFKQIQYCYHDPTFPHAIDIVVNEMFAPKQTVLAVVRDDNKWNQAPFFMSFSKQPQGQGKTIEDAILSCIKSARELLVVNKPN